MTAAAQPASSVRDQVSPEEWERRVELAAAYRLVALYGWDDLVFTHLSVRIPGPEHHFLINPWNLMFEEITASSLVKVDVEGQPVMETPYLTNPAGFTVHSAIHMAREDAQAVMHLHTPQGQAVSAMSFGLLPQTQTAMMCHDVAYHEYEGVALDLAERERLVADLGQRHFMILRNHGTLVVGATLAEAFLRLYLLERACLAQVQMLSAGRDNLHPVRQDVPATVQMQSSPMVMASVARMLAWPALLRKLDRIDPGFRQ